MISWLVDKMGGYPLCRDSSAVERSHCKREGARSNVLPAPTLLSGHQPVYLPGIVLFNKIALSDAFMFVGHCQYRAGSWHSHNFIRGTNGQQKLTVPVHGDFKSPINRMRLDGGPWRRKHLDAIRQTYSKRPYFDFYYPDLAGLLSCYHFILADLNEAIIRQCCKWLGISTPLYRSEGFHLPGKNNQMLVQMCLNTGANAYLSSPGEKAYIHKPTFEKNGLGHYFQVFTHPVYDQGHKEFVSNLSVIDLLFNCGPASGEIVKASGHVG